MLSDFEFEQLCLRLHISQKIKDFINYIRTSEPVRRVGGGGHNVCGTYPSKKMGYTIQYESSKVELPAIFMMENDPNVLEYYDQPTKIKLEYQKSNGKKVAPIYTPDFLVIAKNAIYFEEWKTETDLIKLFEKEPVRYQKNEMGQWCSPPAERWAMERALKFRVRSDSEINWVLSRNFEFLDDYLRAGQQNVSSDIKNVIFNIIKTSPGISLQDLIQSSNLYSADYVYDLIICNEIYVDLNTYLLSEPDRNPVYISVEQHHSFINSAINEQQQENCKPEIVRADIGTNVMWDGNQYLIINNGNEQITLLSSEEQIVKIPKNVFVDLFVEGNIRGINTIRRDKEKIGREILIQAKQADYEIANQRYELVKKKLNGELNEDSDISSRTIREWTKKFKEAQLLYGNGYLGLIPKSKDRGNRSDKLPLESIKLMNEYIEQDYETNKQKSMRVAYGSLINACEEKGIIAPSYKTFTNYIKLRPKALKIEKRKGKRAAYNYNQFYWELELKTPRHGERVFHVCHIDHTELDIELVDSKTNKSLGRPWLTLMTDAYSRKILSFFLTFDPPSYRSVMMVMRDCVRRHSRLPQIVVVDNGKEFSSVYFETLLAYFEVTKKTRPPAKSRFGSVIERMFGTTNTMFIHNLKGNTLIMKDVRQVTKSVNPKTHAVWTIKDLYGYLNDWFEDVYHNLSHPALGQTPLECSEQSFTVSGFREFKLIRYDDEFKVLTLPSTSKGTAKVHVGRGVKIDYKYYWCSEFSNPKVESTNVAVRYDPYDISIAYAYVNNKWVRCISEYYSIFRNRTERELKHITAELKKRFKNHNKSFNISAKMIADFINKSEKSERAFEQAIKDREMQSIVSKEKGDRLIIENQQEAEEAFTSQEKINVLNFEFRPLKRFGEGG
ncbi:DDE-type integrase/transposase/recombinase [Bacillus cereus]|uniref:TnsA endonuclease N-terminal domain-containing protein n=1 Tax=Bacillus cereus TaxID=1396 RepID=UPI0024049FB7|nr:TnsA endonuclease N-terminal domain-containing protein [Bacillus cereus]MDF9484544.1 DDE-type integrase/transposase/recombinase [Bacillus cereus]WIV92659.1 DDE-type integrase/transposase/recombinase [Bacillus bombysepticus]